MAFCYGKVKSVDAVIDIGTNSVRALWRNADQSLREDIRYTRLGEGASRSGILSDRARQRTIEGILSLWEEIPQASRGSFCMTATSAIREARNGQEVAERIEEAVGSKLYILSADDEAYYSFLGATGALGKDKVVLDIGGGSTELTWQEEELQTHSLPIGAVRLAEHPLDEDSLDQALQPLFVGFPSKKRTLIGTGGTITTLSAVWQELEIYRADKINGSVLYYEELLALQERLSAMSTEERKVLPGMVASRADIILPGLAILLAVLRNTHQERVRVSTIDLLYALLEQETYPNSLF